MYIFSPDTARVAVQYNENFFSSQQRMQPATRTTKLENEGDLGPNKWEEEIYCNTCMCWKWHCGYHGTRKGVEEEEAGKELINDCSFADTVPNKRRRRSLRTTTQERWGLCKEGRRKDVRRRRRTKKDCLWNKEAHILKKKRKIRKEDFCPWSWRNTVSNGTNFLIASRITRIFP